MFAHHFALSTLVQLTNPFSTRRPVKNRDGPIAGIPHLGGGGSRQSGPDDNAPVGGTQIPDPPNHIILSSLPTTFHQQHPRFSTSSHMRLKTQIVPLKFPYSPPSSALSSPLISCQGSPPSESDDFCSACKGAGEFVCCDNCPRVFHFLCCDPPRDKAPTGSFSCFECAVEHKPAEKSASSYSSFTPLLSLLENTNTRAFALPTDVQNYFENVSARPDGSYAEVVKRFPL